MPTKKQGLMSPFYLSTGLVSSHWGGLKLNTDAMLLAGWSAQNTQRMAIHRILDLGSGCGILAMILAWATPKAKVIAVERCAWAAHQAHWNVERAQLSARVQVINEDVSCWQVQDRFDLIVSNPPFFPIGWQSPNAQKQQARQITPMLMQHWIQCCVQHLAPQGSLHLIVGAQSEALFLQQAERVGLFCHQKVGIQTTSAKAVTRYLLCFRFQSGPCEEQTVYLQQGAQRSAWFESVSGRWYRPSRSV